MILKFIFEFVIGGEFCELFASDFEFGNVVDLLWGDAGIGGSDNGALAVGEGDDGCAEFDGFKGGVLSYVSGAGYCDFLPLKDSLPSDAY